MTEAERKKPGQRRKPEKTRKSGLLFFRVTAAEEKQVRTHAEANHDTVSAFVRRIVLKAVEAGPD